MQNTLQSVRRDISTLKPRPRIRSEEQLDSVVPVPTVQYMSSMGPSLGPTYISDDVQNRLNQAVDNELAAKQQRKEFKQAQKANRRLERSRKKLAKETARNAAKSTGYDGFMLMFNKKGEQIRVPVVYDDRAVPAPAPVYERVQRTSWPFPDCTVEMIPWLGSLKAFRVKMGNRYQTVVPSSIHDMQTRVMELNANISPVNYWYDGEGLLVCPKNGVPKNGPAKKKTTSAGGAKKKSTAPAKRSAPSKAPAKAPAKTSSSCTKKNTAAPAKPKSASNGGAKKSAASSANRKKAPAKRNPAASRRY